MFLLTYSGPPRPRTPGDFLCGQKVTKKPLKKLRFLRIFLNDGGFLFTLRPVCLLSPISSLGRCQSNLRHHSLALQSSSLGSPPRSTILLRDYRATGMVRTGQISCRVRMAHPLRSSAGSSTWRAGRRSIDNCQSCHWSAQKFGGMAPSCRTALSRAPPAQEEWGCPEGAKPPWRLFGDFLAVQKVTGVRGEEPRGRPTEGTIPRRNNQKGSKREER